MAPTRTLLIANRGEIVLRIARTARAMGIRTVAVYSQSDRNAVHMEGCDVALEIGGLSPSDSYLCSDRLLAAARLAGADAIHPGYGFLSENAAFAAKVCAAGLVWVGPPAGTIEAMGNKATARWRMAALGIAVLPGYDGEDQSAARMIGEGQNIGFPLMVKAASGGGGRGMRLVEKAGDLPAALESASSEAGKSFGDPRLILEKAVIEPRHIEIQLFADTHGNVVHLGERECSVQRRHQKVVEEAPSPIVDAGLRAEMGACAVRIAKEIGYVGAGTVEFLLDRGRGFYFMEMNTRLQVEHPVTELVTGIDMVEWQLRIAAGERLPREQAEIVPKGWAVEARLCAESPGEDYMPSTGRIAAWSPSAGARCDHALKTGLEITPHFDSMLAKIIVHGADRAEACVRLAAALDDTVLLGVDSNRALLARVARDAVFRDGDEISTAFLAQRFAKPEQRADRPDDEVWRVAAWLSTVAEPERWRTGGEWRDWKSACTVVAPWRLASHVSGESVERKGGVVADPDGAVVFEGQERHRVDGKPAPPGTPFAVRIGDGLLHVIHAWNGDTLWVNVRRAGVPGTADHKFLSLRRAPTISGRTVATDRVVLSPLNGRVVGILVEAGEKVLRGQHLASVEAMKMEHAIMAPVEGRIVHVRAKAGDQVAARGVLMEFEPLEQA